MCGWGLYGTIGSQLLANCGGKWETLYGDHGSRSPSVWSNWHITQTPVCPISTSISRRPLSSLSVKSTGVGPGQVQRGRGGGSEADADGPHQCRACPGRVGALPLPLLLCRGQDGTSLRNTQKKIVRRVWRRRPVDRGIFFSFLLKKKKRIKYSGAAAREACPVCKLFMTFY